MGNAIAATLLLYAAWSSGVKLLIGLAALAFWVNLDPYIITSQLWIASALTSSKMPLSDGGAIEIKCRVWPLDVDFWNHLNNARYNRYLEYSRYHWLIRTGLGKAIRKLGVHWGLGGVFVRFRRELKPFQAFFVVTTLGGWDERSIYMEQTVETRSADASGADVRFVHAHATRAHGF